jgi:asparaginyl-tRNA synthetase
MNFISIEEALKKKSGEVAIRGWIHRIRKMKDKIFIVMRDSSDIVQCVFKTPKLVEDADELLRESSLELKGILHKDERAPGGYELEITNMKIIHQSEDFPIGRDQSPEFLLDQRHLYIRSRKMTAIMKIRSTITGAIHEYFRSKDFYEFQSPIMVQGGAEDGPTMFEIKYAHDRKMFLAQTWQLYAEAAMFGLEKLYCIAPSFRAEKSKTSRHLTEFWHAEMEAAWCNLDQLMDYAEEMIKFILKKVIKENKKELKILGRDIEKLKPSIDKKFPRITYDEALEILGKKGRKIKWGKDLRTIEEERLMDSYDTIVFVTHYPKEVMAFYKPKDPKNPKVALCFDALGPEGVGELIGGSERDTNIEELTKSLKESGEKIEDYNYYLDTRKYGSIPHAGFGLGTERLVRWICGLESVKDAIGFPRTLQRTIP